MWKAFLLSACLVLTNGSGFPPVPHGVTTVQVPLHPGLSISYKETHICDTGVRAYAGYVHMPSSYISDTEVGLPFNLSMFFWYFEARQSPAEAPTTIYLAGGPGESSMFGVGLDSGPCVVLSDSNSTAENPWSFNEYSNMLYIDQPGSTGFSYSSTPVNSTLDLLFLGGAVTDTGIVPFDAYNGTVPSPNSTFYYGTLPSQNLSYIAPTSAVAARDLWHFSQAWFSAFPQWRTCNDKINIWGNSYGGYWVSKAAGYFQRQNARIKSGELTGAKVLNLDNIGITNGCIDMLYQAELYPLSAYNNTYDLQVIPENVYSDATNNFTKAGGCRDLILLCRQLGDQYDSDQLGRNTTVNEACVGAEQYCSAYVIGAYDVLSNRSAFDMAHLLPDGSPPSTVAGYFNEHWVQAELGVPLNFTANSNAASNLYLGITGDPFRAAGTKDIEYLLDQGVRVAMVYGDRDYRCPWLPAESFSLAANWSEAEQFRNAGYAYVKTNETYSGGVVRQHGNFSFTRVFEAGHDVSTYQPETVYRTFNRVLFDKDVATGLLPISADYTTSGPSSSFGIKDMLPPAPPVDCYLYAVASTCTQDQYLALANGTADIIDFNIIHPVGGGGPVQAANGL